MIVILQNHYAEFWEGLKVTFWLSGIVWAFGLVVGVVLGLLAARWTILFGMPVRIFAVLLAAVPALVFMFWFHYPFQMSLNIVVDPFITAASSLSVINVVLVANHTLQVVGNFPRQYITAGRLCGLSDARIVWSIGMPIALRQLLPGMLQIQIVMLQSTLFASLISVDEIFRVAQRINSQIYKPVEIYSLLAVFFILICVPLNLLASFLKSRFSRDLSRS
ncbi:MAG: ABC transporter permease subunit [Planctomycetota bacterium]